MLLMLPLCLVIDSAQECSETFINWLKKIGHTVHIVYPTKSSYHPQSNVCEKRMFKNNKRTRGFRENQ